MKKLLMFVVVLLVSGTMMAQKVELKKEVKYFLAIHAGPSFPVGDFKSTSLINSSTGLFENRESGFAKPGINIGINYGYHFTKNTGLAAAVFYNNNKLNNAAFIDQLNHFFSQEFGNITADGLKLDHWQWYGITAGPVFTQNLSDNVLADLRVMGGFANANSPKAVYNDVAIASEDWSIAPVFQAGLDLRFNLGKNMFIITNADYQYMRPKFTVETNIDEQMVKENTKQKFSVINVSGGFGIRF